MSKVIACRLCMGEAGVEPFSVPWDEIGAVLMFCHLEEKHSSGDAEAFRKWCRTLGITV